MKKILLTLLFLSAPIIVNAKPVELYCMSAYENGCQYMNSVVSWSRWISAMGYDGQNYEVVNIKPTRTPGSNAAFVLIAPKQEAKKQTSQSESSWARKCRNRGGRYSSDTGLCL